MPKKITQKKYYEAVGRRKSATARVRLYITGKEAEVAIKDFKVKTGEIVVNGRPIVDFFPGDVKKEKYMTPLTLTKNADRFAVSVQIRGGGINGQLDAMILGISRALELTDKELRTPLKQQGLLTRDSRVKERRKVGTGGKARRKKQSPKR